MTERRRQTRTLGPGKELRFFETEVRSASSDGNSFIVEGLSIRYGATYSVRDQFGEFHETMAAGAASDVVMRGADVRFLFNHDGLPLARTTNGTLTLSDTADGLAIRADIDKRSNLGNDVAIAIERGDITQMSVGMIVGLDEWNDAGTERMIYRLSDLLDVSAVTYPASPTTSIELAQRSLFALPVESRARFRPLWIAARDLREGKPLGVERATLLQEALEAMQGIDDMPDEVRDETPSVETPSLEVVRRNLDLEAEALALRGQRRRIA